MTHPAFTGFPSRPQSTPIPNVFFTDVLPQLTDAVSIAVALVAFNILSKTKGFPRFLTREDFDAEPALQAFLANAGVADPSQAIDDALLGVAALGTLLHLTVEQDGVQRQLYFLNAPADRRGMDSVRNGQVPIGRVVPQPAPRTAPSSVFALYESLVGSISPLIADELAEAERLYPAAWLEAAFREAAAQNARSWRYVSRILERWAIEGPNDEKTERDNAGDTRYFAGKYGKILKQRLGG